jgi:hypothetical protein
LEKALLSQLRAGGSILLYGSLARASATLLSMLCIKNSEALEGDFELQGLGDAPAAGIGRGNSAGSGGVGVGADVQPAGTDATMIRHQSAISAGGLTEVDALAAANRVGGGSRTGTGCDGTPLHTVTVRRRGAERIIARACALSNGRGGAAPRATDSAGGSSPGVVAWVRTISSVDLEAGGLKTRSMKPFAEGRFYRAEKLVRKMLRFTGYELALDRERPAECARHIAVSRHRNGFRFTLFSEERGMKVRLRFPLGAPILEGEPVELRNGAACYRFHRFLYAECRLFLKSNDGDFVECEIVQSLSFRFKHRINLTGLKNATVCFFPPDGDPEKAKVLLNPDLRLLTIGDDFESTTVSDGFGVYQEIRNVTGILSFAY